MNAGREEFQGTTETGWRFLADICGTPMEPGEFLSIAVNAVHALAFLHAKNLTHDRISPRAILVARDDGRVSLPYPPADELDPAYMSPEQTGRSNRRVDQRSDLYALGLTFYRMLTGELPFEGGNLLEWIHCHMARAPRPPQELNDRIPPVLCHIVLKLLQKNAEDRYQTARGLLEDLENCLRQWRLEGAITPFPLAQKDVSERLLLPDKLYGRDEELRLLNRGWERVAGTGSSEVVMVGGYSGMGKTSLVRALFPAVTRRHGFFLTGKCDPLKKDVPYAAIKDAASGLLRQILTQSEERVAAWRAALLKGLGANAQLMNEIVPELELVIGPRPAAPELPAAENRNRFTLVFGQLIGVLAQQEHPLLLFLDDLQWVDSATLKLLEHLALNRELKNLLLVGSYRINEIGPHHPLHSTLERISGGGAAVTAITLSPLPLTETARYLAASLCPQGNGRCMELARLVQEKTGGNPFFMTQFLTTLNGQGLITFDARRGEWAWNLADIRRKGYTENVADLIAERLTKLSPRTLATVTTASFMGSTVGAPLLATLCGLSEGEAGEALGEAVGEGVLVRMNSHCVFVHDKVQEAAYQLVPEPERAVHHLKIGRLLAATLPREGAAEELFEAVNQLDRGLHLITAPEERALLCRLNAAAGRKAKGAAAYHSARDYLAQACALTPPEEWRTSYGETFSLFLDLAECEYLCGAFSRAEELFRDLAARAFSRTDKARVARLRSRLYQSTGHYAEALSVILAALALLGAALPDSEEELIPSFRTLAKEIAAETAERTLPSLAVAPQGTDPAISMLISLLVEGLGPAYAAAPHYFPLLAAKGVHYSLHFGPTPDSGVAYNNYAIVLIALLGEVQDAFALSDMALSLMERLGDPRSRAIVKVGHAGLVLPWRRHFAHCTPLLENAFQELLQAGDFLNCTHTTTLLVWSVLERGAPLEEMQQVARRYLAFARRVQSETAHLTLRLMEQFAACLKGETGDPLSFDSETFCEADCSRAFTDASWFAGLAYFEVMKLISAFIYGFPARALEAAERAEPVLRLMMAMPVAATLCFYRALALAALLRLPQVASESSPENPAAPQARSQEETLKELEQRLARWAADCPDNFESRHALVAAELARLEGRPLEAQELYEKAVLSAREYGFPQQQGVACELAADFHHSRGMTRFAESYLREARSCYARWGAHGKVAQLDGKYPWLTGKDEGGGLATLIGRVDTITVVEATLAISGEIELKNVVDTLMRIVIESAGAQRGYLLLTRGSELSLEARASFRENRVVVEGGAALLKEVLPVSAVNYVRRTGRELILDLPHSDPAFSSDPYFEDHRPQSLLCLPVVRQGALLGLLYLENDLSRDAFPPQRVALLQVLAGQAATALENARVYQELKESEQRYRQLNETLEQRVKEAVGELEQKNRLLMIQSRQAVMGEMVSNIAHQWRQPLNMLGLLAQEIQLMHNLGRGDEVRIDQAVHRLMEILEQMSQTIDDFRLFFRPGREKGTFSIVTVLEKTLALLDGTLKAQRIETDLKAEGTPEVSGYANEFSQVVLNIIMNARDAFISRGITEARRLTVTVGQKGKRTVVLITDNAGGIDEEIIGKIFDPYFTTKGPEQGTGIGLYMCKTIIEKNMNGLLTARNVAGGAEFRIEI